jgi:hypothetical protein
MKIKPPAKKTLIPKIIASHFLRPKELFWVEVIILAVWSVEVATISSSELLDTEYLTIELESTTVVDFVDFVTTEPEYEKATELLGYKISAF